MLGHQHFQVLRNYFFPLILVFLYKQHSVLSKLRVGHVFVVLQKRIPKTANAKA